MIKILNGKKYNTETARNLLERNNGCGYGDFDYVRETLYKKKTGEYFLHGEGGARSQYGKSYSDYFCDGEQIIPLTEDMAKQWVIEYFDGEKYLMLFGDVEE